MKILIITSFFPPQSYIPAFRPYSWAKYWAKAGHEVSVLTTVKRVGKEASFLPIEGFELIEIPFPGLNSILSLFGQAQKSTKQQCTFYQRHEENQKNHNFLSLYWQKWKRCTGVCHGCRMPDPTDLWAFKAYHTVKNTKWDLVVSTAGPYSVHIPAVKLLKNKKAKKWIADWRDLWVDNHIFPGIVGLKWLEKQLEKKWCLTADLVTTVSEPLANKIRNKYPSAKVEVIYNGFDPDSAISLPTTTYFPNDGVRRIVYTGTIYPEYQDPSPLFRAIRLLSQENQISPHMLQVIFYGKECDIRNLAQKEKVSDFISLGGFVPRDQALWIQRDADILLFLEFESDNIEGILTGKLFEYLNAGPSIMGIGLSNNSGVGKILSQTGTGQHYGKNVHTIKKALLKLITKKKIFEVTTEQLAKKQELLTFYSRKHQAEKMLQFVET